MDKKNYIDESTFFIKKYKEIRGYLWRRDFNSWKKWAWRAYFKGKFLESKGYSSFYSTENKTNRCKVKKS